MKVLFIASQFPSYDETFLLREIVAVKESGLPIEICSLRRSRDEVVHPDALPLIDDTYYPPYLSLRTVGDNAVTCLQRPALYLSSLWQIMKCFWKTPLLLLKNLTMFPKCISQAVAIQKRNDIGHVHALWATYAALTAWTIHRFAGVTYSFTGHAHDIYMNQSMLREKCTDAEFLLTCTQDNKTFLSQYCDPEKIHVSYHGLDLTKFVSSTDVSSRSFTLLGVGSLFENKGWKHFIDAVALLRQRGRNVQAVIAGGGPLYQQLMDRIQTLGLQDHVQLSGYVKQDSMPEYYRDADVLVLPALLDMHWGLPNVLIEAMASAIPFLVTRLPAVAEVLQDDNIGLYIDSKSPQSIADAVETLMDNPDKRQAMGRAGRKIAEEKFDISHNGKNITIRLNEYLS